METFYALAVVALVFVGLAVLVRRAGRSPSGGSSDGSSAFVYSSGVGDCSSDAGGGDGGGGGGGD